MKYRLIELEAVDPDEFAAKHGLEMVVAERSPELIGMGMPRYSAVLKGRYSAEIVDGTLLRGCSGDGATPIEAIADHLRIIAGKRIKVDSVYIQCPDKWRLP